MDNQHRMISGYRDLTQNEIDKMNAVKDIGIAIGVVIAEMKTDKELDQRWVSIGATHLQEGLMAIVRAVAKPESF